MNINWEHIKSEILAETKDILDNDKKINPIVVVDLFAKVLTYPIDVPDLDGVSTRIPNALQKILVDPISRVDKNAFFPEVSRIEQYLRKILFLVDKDKYFDLIDKKLGFSAVISKLNLNPNNVDYNASILRSDQNTNFSQQLINTYNLRNLESHNCKDWTHSKLYDSLKSIFIIYIYSTYKHFKKLKQTVEPFDITEYLKKEIEKVKTWQNRFVSIEGKEEFDEINLYAKEILEEASENSDGDEEANVNNPPREGIIYDLRNSIEENQMVILGDVGMGKTTTLQYLHFKDAQDSLKDLSSPIPIYYELKNLTIRDNLFQKLNEIIGIDIDIFEDLLRKGRFNICLDGLNEIEKTIKKNVFLQIKALINDYPSNKFLITSRPQHYNREFDDEFQNRKLPVFILQKMNDSQIEEFLIKNGNKIKDYVLKEIRENNRLKKIIQTPLMLTMLISVVLKEGKIPGEKGKIIRSFMFSLYEREQRQTIDFNKDIFHLLLCYLGFQTRELTGSNAGLDRDEYILPLLEQRKIQLGINTNLLDFLTKANELHILVNYNTQYSFSHELYQEYYAAEYLHQLKE